MPNSRLAWLAAGLMMLSTANCDKNRTSSHGAPDDLDVHDPRKPDVRPTPTARVVFRAGKADEVFVLVEIVQKDEEVRRGLMYRRSMPMNQGMLFLMRTRKVQGFWMRNTLIPLDMIFMDQDLRVVGVVRDTVPMDDAIRTGDKPSRYVLETNAGWARANNVTASSQAAFVGVSGLAN